jgi:hypothetical protein
MACIFPGMDPYLEGPATWPGLHASLIIGIKRYLQPRLLPAYYAEAGERLYIESAQHSIYPDVAVFKKPDAQSRRGSSTLVADLPSVVNWDYQQKEYFLEIRETGTDEVISIIEVLSPTNKTPGANGRDLYLRKQQEVLDSPVHLIEIDLLRDGVATVLAAPGRLLGRGHYDYLVSVSRGDRRGESEVYTSCMRNRLPRPNIPLRSPDPDVVLDLPTVFAESYEEGGYLFRIDYSQPAPGPALVPDDAAWLNAFLSEAGLRK